MSPHHACQGGGQLAVDEGLRDGEERRHEGRGVEVEVQLDGGSAQQRLEGVGQRGGGGDGGLAGGVVDAQRVEDGERVQQVADVGLHDLEGVLPEVLVHGQHPEEELPDQEAVLIGQVLSELLTDCSNFI